MNKQQLRDRIIKRLHKMRAELRETLACKEWWNRNRNDAPPFDLGFEIFMIKCIDHQIAGWEADDMQAVNEWHAKMMSIPVGDKTGEED